MSVNKQDNTTGSQGLQVVDTWLSNQTRDKPKSDRSKSDGAVPNHTEPLSLIESLLKIVKENNCDTFMDQTSTPHISLPEFPLIAYSLKSEFFKRWLSAKYYDLKSSGISDTNFNTMLNILSGSIFSKNVIKQLHTRYAKEGDSIFFDVGDGIHVIKISPGKWEKTAQCDLRFRRFGHQLIQVDAISGGDLSKIFRYVNLSSENDKLLFTTYLCAVMVPDIPRCMIDITGPKGAAKSTTLRFARSLIDPSDTPLLHMHNKHDEIFINCLEHYCLYLDNLSYLKADLSDLFCELITRTAISKRKLYTDQESINIKSKMAIGITGVGMVSERPDLLERSLIFFADRISEENRKDENELWAEFSTDKPEILGALYDVLAKALLTAPTLNLTKKPRMADYARYAASAALAMGSTSERFLKAFEENKSRQNQAALESSILAQLLVIFMKDRKNWCGSSTQLYCLLRNDALVLGVEIGRGGFPGGSNSLWKKIVPIKDTLEDLGVVVKKRPAASNHYTEIEINKVDLDLQTEQL